MFKTLVVITVGFLPSLFSLWIIRKTRSLTRSRIRQAAINLPRGRVRYDNRLEVRERYYLDGVGYLIGDISCQYNARSGYLRCAINPSGSCEGCPHYEPKN